MDGHVAVDRRAALQPHRGVRGAAVDGAAEGQRAGLGADDGEAGRLGDQAGVEAVVALERGERPQAAVLLGRHAQQHDLRRRRPAGAQRGERVQRRDHAALHVDRAAPVDAAVRERARPRPVPPRLASPAPRRRRGRRGRAARAACPRSVDGQREQLAARRLLAGMAGVRAQGARGRARSAPPRARAPARARRATSSAARSCPVTLGICTSAARSAASALGVDPHAVHVASSTRRQLPCAICSRSASPKPAARSASSSAGSAGDVAQRGRHRRAVEVRAEADRADPGHLGDVRGVGDDQGQRRVRVLGAVGAEEADVEVDADEAAALADRAQLVVGQVARRGAERVRAGVRGDQRPPCRARRRPRSRAR